MTDTSKQRGAPAGMEKAIKHFGATFKSLVELRMRAAVAAALAEIALVPHPWPKPAFQRLVAGIAKAVSLYTQASAIGTSLGSDSPPAQPPGLASTMLVTLRYESAEDSWREGNGALEKDPKARHVYLDVPAAKIAPFSRDEVGKMILSIHLDEKLPLAAKNLLEHDLQSQLVKGGFALGLVDFQPRPNWMSRPASNIKEVLWDVRIRMSVFVTLFLGLYRDGLRFPDPFLVFFLEPCRLGRANQKGIETHVRSGFLGYSYLIDDGQRLYLSNTFPDVDPSDLEGEMALPFPDGLCGSVFLQGADSAPVLANDVIATYEQGNNGTSKVEWNMLKDRVLLELPVHVADIETLSPDGPELILAIAIPRCSPEPEDFIYNDAIQAIPLEQNKGDSRETYAERIERFSRSPNPVFKPGEFQILREVSRRLIGEFVRTPAVLAPDGTELLGNSGVMRHVESIARVLALSKRPILVLGPAGSGKTLLARKIHSWSPRQGETIRVTSGASFSEDLGRSELFGYMKGSHSTANVDTPGILENIAGSTLFIDDFDALPRDVQAMLLAVMEHGEFRRVGENGGKPRIADVRFILATNATLDDLVAKGMRRDFLTRLAGCVTMPPLDQRREDIPTLVRHFVEDFVTEQRRTIKDIDIQVLPVVLDTLCDTDWSDGEVRALRNVVEMACTKLLAEASETQFMQPRPKLVLRQKHVDWALDVQPPRTQYARMDTPTASLAQGEINANAAALGAGLDYSSFTHARSVLEEAVFIIRTFCEERINASGHDIALTASATAACEAGVLALAPDADLVLYTDLVHPNVERAIESISQIISLQRGKAFVTEKVALRHLVTPGIDASTLAAHISEALLATAASRRAIVVLEHVAYEEGLRLPIDAICATLKDSSLQILIDAAQAVGVWRPRNQLTAHLFGCFHKFIGGPGGTGFLALKDGASRLPYSISYTTNPNLPLDFPTTDIRKWELTSLAISKMTEQFGDPEETEDTARRFMDSLRMHLGPFTGTLHEVTDPELQSHILSVRLATADQARLVVDSLVRHNIRVQQLHNCVRVSMGARSKLADAQRIGSMLRYAVQSTAQH